MAARVPLVDWREEFAQLAPYLNGKAGVVRIRYMGESSAPSRFIGALTSEYEFKDSNKEWRSIRIDHEVYTVRYLVGIRDEFIRKLKVELPEADAVQGAATLQVFADVQADGDIDAKISNVSQNNYFNGNNPALMARNRERW